MTTIDKGFRLDQIELLNWGTFNRRVWSLTPKGQTYLVTGENGSGKSTLIDALTTLLVPAHKVEYNKAAGSEQRERTLRSYIAGHYTTTKSDLNASAKPVPLRDESQYTVILGVFSSPDLGQSVTIAQVFWLKDDKPERFYVVADEVLGITSHFADFGTDPRQLRKRLLTQGVQVPETYTLYEAMIMKRFGLTPQGIELFHQTVSMKAVLDLGDFVREHMLEQNDSRPRIDLLIANYDHLSKAHDLVLVARQQIKTLTPMVARCREYRSLEERRGEVMAERAHVGAWIAVQLKELIREHRITLLTEQNRLKSQYDATEARIQELDREATALRRQIWDNGGNRLEEIAKELTIENNAQASCTAKRVRYEEWGTAFDLRVPESLDVFTDQRLYVEAMARELTDGASKGQDRQVELKIAYATLMEEHKRVSGVLTALRSSKTNMDANQIQLRDWMCAAVPGLVVTDLPFIGELIQVLDAERAWEGAIERVLHGFALGMLVPDKQLSLVREWVNNRNIGRRLEFYGVPVMRSSISMNTRPKSLVTKIVVKDGDYKLWLEGELNSRYGDMLCCDSSDELGRVPKGVTKEGLLKSGGSRYVKDDRQDINNRRYFLLGWSNAEKIALFEAQVQELEEEVRQAFVKMGKQEGEMRSHAKQLQDITRLLTIETFAELDVAKHAAKIASLTDELEAIKRESQVLAQLEARLTETLDTHKQMGKDLERLVGAKASNTDAQGRLDSQEVACDAASAPIADDQREVVFPRLDDRSSAGKGPAHAVLTIDSWHSHVTAWSAVLIDELERSGKEISKVGSLITGDMRAFNIDFPILTQEIDPNMGGAPHYEALLRHLETDDLPKYAQNFKSMLNENTIRNIVTFQNVLFGDREDIIARIAAINTTLREIEYGPGTYIVLAASACDDQDIRDFQEQLRVCTSNTVSGSDDDGYSETKFEQVSLIIERLRGRKETYQEDVRWTEKVTDVRRWFDYSAIENLFSDNSMFAYHDSSSGKSGGQKEKLAYTVLAASLTYQFGTEIHEKPRSFRFVVIDEAFSRGSEEATKYGLNLFKRLGLQLLIATPLLKIDVIEPFVAGVGLVVNKSQKDSSIKNVTIEEHLRTRAERRAGG